MKKPKLATSDFITVVKLNEKLRNEDNNTRNSSKKVREETVESKNLRVEPQFLLSSFHNKNSKSTNFDFAKINLDPRSTTFKLAKQPPSNSNLLELKLKHDAKIDNNKATLKERNIPEKEKLMSGSKQSRKSIMVFNDGTNLRKINIEQPNPFDQLLKNESLTTKKQNKRDSSFKVLKMQSDKQLQNAAQVEESGLPDLKSNTLLSNSNLRNLKLQASPAAFSSGKKKKSSFSLFQCFGCK